MELGRLHRIDLRKIWETEAQHFTPWLAQTDNIQMLSDTLGMELEVEAQEKQVGPFRADILCKDVYSENWVLIENQLEKTDHRHLGQLLTYAAGLQAVTIVWIAAEFNDEHRAAMDWLNKITDEDFQFFGLEVEIWKIDETSRAAPKFNIISKPNEWSRQTKRAAKYISSDAPSETKLIQLDFWRAFSESLQDHPYLKTHTPRPQHWLNLSIGKSGIRLGGLINSSKNTVGVELYIRDGNIDDAYQKLYSEKELIENEIGQILDWRELPERTASRIVLMRENSDVSNNEKRSEIINWMKETVIKFDRTFRKRVKAM